MDHFLSKFFVVGFYDWSSLLLVWPGFIYWYGIYFAGFETGKFPAALFDELLFELFIGILYIYGGYQNWFWACPEPVTLGGCNCWVFLLCWL